MHHVLHARDVKHKLIDVYGLSVAGNEGVARVFRILLGEHLTPNQNREWLLGDARMDG